MRKLTKKGLEEYIRFQWATMEKDLVDLSRNKKYKGSNPEQFKKILNIFHKRFHTTIPHDAHFIYYVIDFDSLTLKRQPLDKIIAQLSPVVSGRNIVLLDKGDYVIDMDYDFRTEGLVDVEVTIKKAVGGLFQLGKTYEDDNIVGYSFVGTRSQCSKIADTELANLNYTLAKQLEKYPDDLTPIKKWKLRQDGTSWTLTKINSKGKETERSKDIASFAFHIY